MCVRQADRASAALHSHMQPAMQHADLLLMSCWLHKQICPATAACQHLHMASCRCGPLPIRRPLEQQLVIAILMHTVLLHPSDVLRSMSQRPVGRRPTGRSCSGTQSFAHLDHAECTRCVVGNQPCVLCLASSACYTADCKCQEHYYVWRWCSCFNVPVLARGTCSDSICGCSGTCRMLHPLLMVVTHILYMA